MHVGVKGNVYSWPLRVEHAILGEDQEWEGYVFTEL